MIELFPAKCVEILRRGGRVWAGVVMNHHNTPAWHATSLILDLATQFFRCVDCGALRQEVHKQKAFSVSNNVHMIFRAEMVCLNFVSVGDEVCLHSIDWSWS